MSETVTHKRGHTLFRTRLEIADKWRLETVVYFDSSRPLTSVDCVPSRVLDVEVFKDSLSSLTHVKVKEAFLKHLDALDFGKSLSAMDSLSARRLKRDLVESFADLSWHASNRFTKAADVSLCYTEGGVTL